MLKRFVILILLIKLGIGAPAAIFFSNTRADILRAFASPTAGRIADAAQPYLERIDSFFTRAYSRKAKQ